MKDRFLFKAKRIDNGEWIIGFLTFHKTGKAFIKPIFGDARSSEEIDPSTICQCTGLKDKNGNLIWENDILFLKDEINGCKWKAVVEFGNPTGEYNWGWQLVQVTECEANKDILLWIETEMSYMDAKIIGNTIDNLELVESEE